jgi:hypothetical protein
MIAEHPLATADPALARALSKRITSSVAPGTAKTYSSGFNSLKRFAEPLGLPFLPTDKVTLGAWFHHEVTKSKPTKMASLRKYMAGVRWEHLVNGFDWIFAGDEWLELVKHSIRKEFPTTPFLKVPFTEHLIRQLTEHISGWPILRRLSFNDLLWVCASAILHFACLRGGELATRKGAGRPPIRGEDVIVQNGASKGVAIRVRQPKTQPGSAFQTTFAKDCPPTPYGSYALNPSTLLLEYRARAEARSLDVVGSSPAFKMANGKVLSMDFMLKRANELKAKAGLRFLDADGADVPFRAASWRAGHVLSARIAKVPEFQIRATGRWASDGGPAPYSMSSEEAFTCASAAIVAAGAGVQLSKVYHLGAFSSSLAVFQATESSLGELSGMEHAGLSGATRRRSAVLPSSRVRRATGEGTLPYIH